MFVPILVMFCKFGITANFNVIYIVTASMFDSKVSASVFGVCNFFARLTTISAPLVAELPEPWPINSLVVLCAISSVVAFFLPTQS